MGDLNYRVYDSSKSAQELIAHYHSGQIEELQVFDQLSQEFSRKSGFLSQFYEAPINFLPTYKFIPGTGKLDSSRIPSWCDRILISSPFSVYRFVDYFSVPSCHLSDHLPVMALFELLPRPISHNKRHAELKLLKSTCDPLSSSKRIIGLAADSLAGIFFFMYKNIFLLPSVAMSVFLVLTLGFKNI
ncbi:hypothetical protein DSO57_1027938 [Entomophthora muscae]|uniref:Uncharacterized protein n=1 Tax=Entomophthora muscae TaxID=34485 RepID=A0ACC2T1V2_9FUNG|nr:hypothetical protein DSO57_1027938 [Entomophthora muscae]